LPVLYHTYERYITQKCSRKCCSLYSPLECNLYCRTFTLNIPHHHHHLSGDMSTAGHRPPPKFSTTIGPAPPSSSSFPRPSPDRRSTLWGASQRCVSRYAVAIRGPSVFLEMCPAHCHLRFAIRRAISVTLVHLRISSFLLVSCGVRDKIKE
jgi:hypothetical protein